MVLENIKSPDDIKGLSAKEYTILARQIRDFLIEKLSVTGGHLSSNLGVVELTIAIYIAFDMCKDKVIWDVGHQSYTHKILSGRAKDFDNLRKYKGISGFPKCKESIYDVFNTGHSTTSISVGLGLCKARDILGEDYNVVSVIGDGSLTGGMAYEALNNAAQMKKNFIVILNDNNMSISKNVGGISKYLAGIRTDKGYNKLKQMVATTLDKIPVLGKGAIGNLKNTKNGIKQLFIPGMFFENMGITYLGPIDGHNISDMVKVFKEAKKLDHAVLIHVRTIKGKGYTPAQKDPEKYHGVGKFNIADGKLIVGDKSKTYTDIFSETICELAVKDKSVVAITAAMPNGTGLVEFSKRFPERFFDVGIAEQHAVTMAAGMASGGLKPVVAIYSSFLQRAFDQIIHDVCLQKLKVIFAIDRAGLVGADGETHQGIFDLSYLNLIPYMTVLAPKNDIELREMLKYALEFDKPIAIRYPRGVAYTGFSEYNAKIEYGKSEILFEEKDIAIFALGSMVSTGKHLREKLKKKGLHVSLINARFVKPVDYDMIAHLCKRHKLIITLEENVLRGGLGLMVDKFVGSHFSKVKVLNISIPDEYIDHGDVTSLRKEIGIDSDSVIEKVLEYLKIGDL